MFLELLTSDRQTGYIDGATDYELLQPFSLGLSQESKLWLAFLYSLSYSCTTAMRIYCEYPTISDVNPKSLQAFWEDNKDTLWFNPDRKYLKNMNQVVPAIKSLYKLSNHNLTQYMTKLLNKGFDEAYKEILATWDYFGPMGAYLFFDAIYGLTPELYSDPTNLDWKHSGQTVVEGMAHLIYDDKAIETKNYDYEKYNRIVNKLVKKSGQPKVIIESTLCLYRKLFKGTRYVGYYADRQLTECLATADILQSKYGIDVWDLREQSMPSVFRGEIHNWNGIRKERLKLFLNTGEVM